MRIGWILQKKIQNEHKSIWAHQSINQWKSHSINQSSERHIVPSINQSIEGPINHPFNQSTAWIIGDEQKIRENCWKKSSYIGSYFGIDQMVCEMREEELKSRHGEKLWRLRGVVRLEKRRRHFVAIPRRAAPSVETVLHRIRQTRDGKVVLPKRGSPPRWGHGHEEAHDRPVRIEQIHSRFVHGTVIFRRDVAERCVNVLRLFVSTVGQTTRLIRVRRGLGLYGSSIEPEYRLHCRLENLLDIPQIGAIEHVENFVEAETERHPAEIHQDVLTGAWKFDRNISNIQVNQSINQSNTQWMNEWTDQSINQSINQLHTELKALNKTLYIKNSKR